MRFRTRLALLLMAACAVIGIVGAGSAFAATPAAGFAVSDWATGMVNTGPNGVGPVGIAADPNSTSDIYVTNYASGTLYKYSAATGGVEGPAHQVSVSGAYGGNNAAGIAFDKDGKLYVAFQAWWAVGEIDKTDGHIIRYLSGPYGYFFCATGIATDPLSGDLFVSSPCGWPIVRVPTSGTGGAFYGSGGIDGVTFGPDGTLWGAGGGLVWKIDGTNKPVPGTATAVAYVAGGDGISVAAASDNPSLPPFVFVNGNYGNIVKVDLSGPSPVYSDVTTGGSRGDFSTVGYDGCLYATQTDRVIKVTNADGSCSLAPVTPDDATSLTVVAPASDDYHDTIVVSATLKNLSKSTLLSGQTVAFTLGSTGCSAVTDASGVATCSITIADPAGPATLTAHFDGAPKIAPATSTKPFTITLEETTLAYTGASGSIQNGATVTLSGVLKEDGTTAIAGATVAFTIGTQGCSAITNAAGLASCAVIVAQPSGPAPITATYAGSSYYLDAADSATATISAASKLVYTGATSGDYHDPATLSAKLTSALTAAPIAGAAVTLTLGAQSCSDSTNAAGVAACSITPNTAAGSQPITATFAGNGAFDPSSDSATFTVTREETKIAYTGVTGPVSVGSTVTLSAVLKEDGTAPIASRAVTLTIGSQSCVDGTNAAGVASCSVVVAQATGPAAVSAAFAGDSYYLPATDADSVLIYGFAPGGGSFVVGNQTATGAVTFWGAQWAKVNKLSGGDAPSSFKGFAKSPAAPGCGTGWTTAPGNSTPPPAGPLPAYMAVTVASTSSKSGSTISGNSVHVVVVRTNAGYGPDPSQTGTGTVVATLC